jgi:hypothetical protein
MQVVKCEAVILVITYSMTTIKELHISEKENRIKSFVIPNISSNSKKLEGNLCLSAVSKSNYKNYTTVIFTYFILFQIDMTIVISCNSKPKLFLGNKVI